MRRTRHLTAALAAAAVTLLAGAAGAEDFTAGAITVDGPWARPTIGEAKNTAAYMKIENGGDAPDTLVSAASDVAGHVMLHESRMDGDVMKMVHLSDGIAVPAHGSAELKPLGLHIMIMGLNKPLKAGDTFPLVLKFEKQGEVPITVSVGKDGTAAGGGGMHDHH
jgi:periplasmic copper chaperone A